MDLKSDAKSMLLRIIKTSPAGRRELGSQDMHSLLVVYFNWVSRFVEPRPRLLKVAPDVHASAAHHSVTQQVAEVLAEIRRGADLTPRLSGSVHVGYAAESERRCHRHDLDLLLNDWGVHHLHLGARMGTGSKRVERTGPLLFVSFVQDTAYAIALRPHGKWSDETILGVMAKNWPDEGVIHRVHGSLGLSHPVPQVSRALLRDAHVNPMYEDDNGVFRARGFLSLAGTSLMVTEQANAVVRLLEWLQSLHDEEPKRLAGLLGCEENLQSLKVHLAEDVDGRWALATARADGPSVALDELFAMQTL